MLLFQIGKVGEDLLLAHATGQVLQNIRHGDACADDAGLAAAHARGTGDQIPAGAHDPWPTDDSQTLAVAPGDPVVALREIESRVTACPVRFLRSPGDSAGGEQL